MFTRARHRARRALAWRVRRPRLVDAWRPVALIGTIATGVAMVLTVFGAGGDRALWENVHWTLAAATAVATAGLSTLGASGRGRSTRLWLSLDAALCLAGQVLLSLESALGLLIVTD